VSARTATLAASARGFTSVGYTGPRIPRQGVCSCPRDRAGLSCEKRT
jgi:hypothetical protein